LIGRDITVAKRSLETLKYDQRFLRALLENLPDEIYFKDRESRYLRVSHAMATKFGVVDPQNMLGKTDAEFFTADHAQASAATEQEIIRTERPVINAEEREAWADGRVTWVSTTKLPFYNEYGQPVGTFGISRDITARKNAEIALIDAQRSLLEASRLAGMAEVASGVLHNIGNAFNSVNTSAALVADQLSGSRVVNLGKVVQMFEEHAGDLPVFLSQDPRGRQLPAYLGQLSKQLLGEREGLLREIESLRKGIDHIKSVITMQQSYAHASSLAEDVAPSEIVDEALRISEVSLSHNKVVVVREFEPTPMIHAARHKILQILVNLIRNAKHAMDDNGLAEKRLVIAVRSSSARRIQIVVTDNGTGIAPENLSRIFAFGFTTKKTGHGFGLHSSALAAQEMDGSLVAHSGGRGQGAEFILELPATSDRP
jgi:PAS domain S-box-containing protein